MIPPAIPENEAERLASLKSLHILDTPIEERFDRITRIAQRVFGVPIALISLMDGNRQWFKSVQGLSATETSREVSFCGHAIHSGKPLVVQDATKDRRFFDNPLVTESPNIRFYAGYPITSPEGFPVGTVCIVDNRARSLSADDKRILGDLSALAEQELHIGRMGEVEQQLRSALSEAERRASIDGLTRLWNRAAIERILAGEMDRARRSGQPLCVFMTDIDRFKSVNDTHGHQTGDRAIAETASRLQSSLRAYDSVGRLGGDEFLAVLPNCRRNDALMVAERCRRLVGEAGICCGTTTVSFTISLGIGAWEATKPVGPSELVAAADQALYMAKEQGRNCSAMVDLG